MVDEERASARLEPVVLLLAREESLALLLGIVVAERDAERRAELFEDRDERLHRRREVRRAVAAAVHVVAGEDDEPRFRRGERGAKHGGGSGREFRVVLDVRDVQERERAVGPEFEARGGFRFGRRAAGRRGRGEERRRTDCSEQADCNGFRFHATDHTMPRRAMQRCAPPRIRPRPAGGSACPLSSGRPRRI